MNINQFHSGVAYGDAITNQMLMLQKLLHEKGYHSGIYAEHLSADVDGGIKSIFDYEGNPDDILIVHHSMGMDAFDKIKSLPDKKILIYHNITPEEFFEDENTKKYIRKGLQQLKEYSRIVDYCIADSNYNRRDMIKAGFANRIDIMPVNISVDRFDTVKENPRLLSSLEGTTNIIFVGRLVGNKKQSDVIKCFSVYHNIYNAQSRLYLVGATGNPQYVDELRAEAAAFGVENAVILPGKVPEEDLKAYYMAADVFLCMSEHEGFGVPLLEAMYMGVPVVAYRAGAVPETMGGSGIVVNEKNHDFIGTLIDEIVENNELKQKLVEHQRQTIKRLQSDDTEGVLFKAIDKLCNGTRKLSVQMQGPFETSYSLAIVNRKLIEAINDREGIEASIYCTEGPGDYTPKAEDLKDKPIAEQLWKKSGEMKYPDVVIRNMYPPRAHDVNGGLNFYAFGWEESIIPETYINDFNKYIDGIGTMSQYVTDKLIECGIKVPVKTMGIGVELCPDYENIKPFNLKSKKKTVFLHISSAFPRKGVDAMLKGYYEAFDGDDDVCLLLKTFPNPHNRVEEILARLGSQYANPPEVEWINRDLPEEQLYGLYKAADCYVSVARGEGFGLPVAEAMLAKVPVIVSANSGMNDFCKEETAFLVSNHLELADTHLNNNAGSGQKSYWYEPEVPALVKALQDFVCCTDQSLVREKVENAYNLIAGEYTWQKVAERWLAFVEEVEASKYVPRVDMVTSWNTKCGIAEYSRSLVEYSANRVDYRIYPNYGASVIREDEKFVQERLWQNQFDADLKVLTRALCESASEIVHVQFNFSFFSLDNLSAMIDEVTKEKKMVITFHSTQDVLDGGKAHSLRDIMESLNKLSAVIVHQPEDETRLTEFGMDRELIHRIPIGQAMYPECNAQVMKREMGIKTSLLIGSYGFLLPHKGVKETIMAMPQILKYYPDAIYMPVCALYDAPESVDYYNECMVTAKNLGVEKNVKFITDFLPDEESIRYLQCCDVIGLVYAPTKESASASVRFGVAALRPVLTTKQDIFADLREFTYQIPNNDPANVAKEILLMADESSSQRNNEYVEREKAYIEANSRYVVANKLSNIYRMIVK
ncbi:glycosyltransferase [Anaerovibrio lipolyticus]|uniref:glycosyltransferase family 4 protein n=1 Tax=Anaerovibrio lipolyticus TaxID=82374 RepID=UPI0023F0D161|nr:glycosyltransferase [Anaerovibrio lipolyticus]